MSLIKGLHYLSGWLIPFGDNHRQKILPSVEMKSQCWHSWSWSHPEGHTDQSTWKLVFCLRTEIMTPQPGLPHLWVNIPGPFSFPLWFGFVFSPPPRSCLRLPQPAQVNIQNHSEYSRKVWPAKSRAGLPSHIISNNETYAGVCLFDLSLITWLAPSELPTWIPGYFHANCFLIYLTNSALVSLYLVF